VRAKNVRKKSSEKSKKKPFFSHEYRYQKMGEKNALKFFSRDTRIMGAKNVGKRSSGKRAKKRFLYSHEYRDPKKGGGETRKTIFSETHE